MFRIVLASTLAFTLSAAFAEPPAEVKKTPDVVGLWEGVLDAGPIKVRLAFKIKKNDDGTFAGTMDSPDQGAKDLKLSAVSVAEESVKFELGLAKAEFVGKPSSDGQTLTGEWKQSGKSFPLELKRVSKLTEVKRPQNPVKPYPYFEEEVKVDGPTPEVKLAGTFTRPKEAGKYPAVVLITGSGPQDRDETLMGHKPFLVLSDALTRAGIAVLRCDDRGIGKSTGKFGQATSADFAQDAYAAVKYLKTRDDVEGKKIGLAGHSEGGLIAPMVAAEHPDDIAFIVLLAGPGTRGDEVLMDQMEALLKAAGSDDGDVTLHKKMQAALLAVVIEFAKPDEQLKKLEQAAKDFAEKLTDDEKKKLGGDLDVGNGELKKLADPWMTYFVRFDPRPTLKKVRCSVLAINGEKDLQVLPKRNLAEVGKALKEGGNQNVTLREMPGLNHLFQHSKTGLPSEYGSIEETFAPEALAVIVDWIKATTK